MTLHADVECSLEYSIVLIIQPAIINLDFSSKFIMDPLHKVKAMSKSHSVPCKNGPNGNNCTAGSQHFLIFAST